VFRADGWRVLPYPVDYLTTGRRDGRVMPGLDLTAGLRVMGIALHEWLGLAYYRLRGWTDALVPAPDGAL
ncbi:MAG TPA: YdcF family protein, partial [Candidatus Omnitrophota bacterium]|nr:YdcF family protein [Candidatus Omnitrophota bacterium]